MLDSGKHNRRQSLDVAANLNRASQIVGPLVCESFCNEEVVMSTVTDVPALEQLDTEESALLFEYIRQNDWDGYLALLDRFTAEVLSEGRAGLVLDELVD